MFRARNLHTKFYTSAAGDPSDIKKVWQKYIPNLHYYNVIALFNKSSSS